MVQKTNIFRMAEDFDTSFEGQEYSTFHLPNSFLISSKYGRGASADDAVDVKVFRYADYSGGTAYETNIALQVQTSAGAGGENLVDADRVVAVGLEPGELAGEVAGADGGRGHRLVVGEYLVVAEGHEASVGGRRQRGAGANRPGDAALRPEADIQSFSRAGRE